MTPLRSFLLLLTTALLFYFCQYQVSHSFRKNYSDHNELLHSDSANFPYLKVHFKNGDVSVLDYWNFNVGKDSISGPGKLYDFNRNQIQEGAMSFSFEDIAIIETNQLEAIKSKDKGRLATLGILTAANVIGGIACLINPKACFGSCPTFYINDNTFIHTASAEGFSSSIAPSLERTDVDALRFSTSANRFDITMKNEALETHMINNLAIQAILKSQNENVFHDKYGKYFICDGSSQAKYAVVEEKDILNSIRKIDDFEYSSPSDSFDLTTQ